MIKTPINLALLCDPVGAQFCEPLNSFSMFDQLDCTPCALSAIGAYTEDPNTITVIFSACVNTVALTGIEYQINGGSWTASTGYSCIPSGLSCDYSTGIAISPGDSIRWRYQGGQGSILDCVDAEDIGAQEIAVENTLVLPGDFILLESGGIHMLLIEDDSGMELESAS